MCNPARQSPVQFARFSPSRSHFNAHRSFLRRHSTRPGRSIRHKTESRPQNSRYCFADNFVSLAHNVLRVRLFPELGACRLTGSRVLLTALKSTSERTLPITSMPGALYRGTPSASCSTGGLWPKSPDLGGSGGVPAEGIGPPTAGSRLRLPCRPLLATSLDSRATKTRLPCSPRILIHLNTFRDL